MNRVHSACGSIPVENLSALIARLEAAEAGSRELDHLIFMYTAPMEVASHWSPSDRKTLFTTSLDAALALAERVLPGWYWRAGRTPLGHWHHGRYTYGWAHVSRTDASNCDRGDEATGWAATPAIALVIATLRAKLDGYAAVGEVNKNPKAQEG
ncbi:MAG: hypothetical protein BGO02_03955 [Brevundimonas sp. 67-6]|nr:MAG: hypothetical protein BGO02_03955 [Brevundimonas sp. 67-6]